ncbi:hypothetical protein LTR56_006308 [Elasticomyces elasticus]|nr:hypothetical protein LTR56_006308 [Elasticomyces elasticus]KAK3663356.1 hypothetical protein LTR22_005763 [Elasticomyces elasticus]KAK4925435.1 hypothetical protein LTR49_007499 [Elasticomyces elasticus]KAK5764530.1 hypothetical protein LTS12_005260 [Elasticomyces elasticus]
MADMLRDAIATILNEAIQPRDEEVAELKAKLEQIQETVVKLQDEHEDLQARLMSLESRRGLAQDPEDVAQVLFHDYGILKAETNIGLPALKRERSEAEQLAEGAAS